MALLKKTKSVSAHKNTSFGELLKGLLRPPFRQLLCRFESNNPNIRLLLLAAPAAMLLPVRIDVDSLECLY